MNIFLISIDNLRYDCVGFQPFKKELEKYSLADRLKTPTLDSIAEKSVCFTQAITTTPYTTSAHASLLTGLYPPSHGLRAFWNHKMKTNVKTLPEILRESGYKTVLFTDTIHFNEHNGLNRGFDYKFVKDDKKLIECLSENKNEKLFVLVHFFDVHAPFIYSENEIYAGYNSDYYQVMKKLYKEHNLEAEFRNLKEKPYDLWNNFLMKVRKTLTPKEDMNFCLSTYIDGINKFDSGRFNFFIENLKDLGIYETSAIFVFSDHGEGKSGKDNNFDHLGEVFDSTIRIPIIMSHPDFNHSLIDVQVSIVDIFPTVMETIIGGQSGEGLSYEISGTNLLADRKNISHAYCETWLGATEGDIFSREYYLRQRAVRTKNKKYIVYGKAEDVLDVSIYDLENKEFVIKLQRALLFEPENSDSDVYIDLLDSKELIKDDLLHIFLSLQNSNNESRFVMFDLVNDPMEENPIDPTKDISLMADFAKHLNIILAIESEGEGPRVIERNSGSLTRHIRPAHIAFGVSAENNVAKKLNGKIPENIPLETLEEKEQLSMDIIKTTVDYFGIEDTATTFTGGKDSTVLLHLIKRLFHDVVPLRVFNIDTSFKFKEIYEFRDAIAGLWNIYLIVLRNESAAGLSELVKDHEKCCSLLKVTPLNNAIEEYGIKALMTAIRWDEQEARAGEEYFAEKKGYVRVQPILHFTEKDIWDYIKKYDIPYCSLYDKGYRSLGCEPCTKPSGPGGPERSGRDQKKEKTMKRLRELGYF